MAGQKDRAVKTVFVCFIRVCNLDRGNSDLRTFKESDLNQNI